MRSRCSSSSALFILSQLMSYQKAGYVIFYSSRKNIDFVISNQHPQSCRELPLNAYYIGFPRKLHWALCLLLPLNDQIKFNQIHSRYISNFFFSVPYSMRYFHRHILLLSGQKNNISSSVLICVVSSTDRNPN